jgi:hypothetical protein
MQKQKIYITHKLQNITNKNKMYIQHYITYIKLNIKKLNVSSLLADERSIHLPTFKEFICIQFIGLLKKVVMDNDDFMFEHVVNFRRQCSR